MKGKSKRGFDEAEALRKAVAIFWEKGYEAAGVEELVQAMNIRRQSMYTWVGDKMGLFIAALKFYQSNYMKPLLELPDQPGSPMENLEQMLIYLAEYAKQEDCQGCLITNAMSEFGPDDAKVQDVLKDIDQSFVDALHRVLEQAKERGEIRKDTDTLATARTLAVMRNGIMLAGRLHQDNTSVFAAVRFMIDNIKTKSKGDTSK